MAAFSRNNDLLNLDDSSDSDDSIGFSPLAATKKFVPKD